MVVRVASAAIIVWSGLATPALSGAWLRDKGTGFYSISTTFRDTPSGLAVETDGYIEYGAWPRVTLGATLNETQGSTGHILGFLRLPIRTGAERAKWAAEIGLGAWHIGPDWRPMGKLTLSYGRGLSWGKQAQGWFSVDASVEHRQGKPDPTWALQTTLGQSFGGKVRPMVKLGLEHIDGSPLGWSASAHILIDGPKRLTWVAGIERKRAGDTTTALSLGLWKNF